MLSSIRIADVLLLLLISQTTQAGPVRRAERLFGRGWNSTASAVTSLHSTSSTAPDPTDLSTSAKPVTAQKEDGSTPSPIFTTLDDQPRSSPAATQPVGQGPPTTVAQSITESPSTTGTEPVFLPPPLSTISISSTTSGAGQDGSITSGAATLPPTFSSISLPPFPTTNARNTTAVPADGERGASPGQTMQSSLSFAFPVPGQTTAASTAPAEQPAASSTSAPELSTTASSPEASTTSAAITSTLTAQPSAATLKVTGTPLVGVPTIETSIPAATATVSPEVAASNLANAKTFNSIFATLTEQSACSAGQVACVKGNKAKCGSDGAFEIETCEAGTSCFALPMNTTEGVIIKCYDPALARNILGDSVTAPAPGSSTSAPAQAPPASGVVSEIRTTVTPTSVVVSTVSVKVPEATSPAAPIATATSTVLVEAPEPTSTPGVTTTVFITRTIDRESSTATEKEPTTTTGGDETTLITSTRRRTRSSTSAPESTAPAATETTTITDTLTFAPIPSTVPTFLVGAKATDAPAPGVVTVRVTVTEKEIVTVTTTAKNIETLILTVTKIQ
ncbi:hypothetical protein CkaCkLH20_09034 [Colletotrichum karsti]|uniref:Carbohydrate-binding module family 19 domain-containing protein n=1 Tax=Colletotrichum karsti TaxID=1095194 RepID=A0A9P6I0I5_9PEZI|nr:uncharacterized protein CkaCkLH20_09034 [Colletotrichum karsti]KAF9873575.1 hypothetical protein CkaCkLH20_09034 [Colletotrichum karsti]